MKLLKLTRVEDDLKEDLKDPDFKKAYKREKIFASIAVQIARMREANGLTQAQLAKKLNISQQAISRLEQLDHTRYSLTTLIKLADTFHKQLKVQFV